MEAILTVYQYPGYPIVVQCIGIYASPKATYGIFIQELNEIINTLNFDNVIIVIGDFNMKSITNRSERYNDKLIDHMRKQYNINEYVQNYTTSYRSKLDLCFSNRNLLCTTIWNHWSDHRIICASLPLIPLFH